ncbi:MAG TPA: hypothetical protein VKP78_09735 [bacterium]|nr:hypothetical protein [bacterium]
MLNIILIGLVLLGTVIEGAYFFRVIQVVYFKDGNPDIKKAEAPAAGLIPMIIFASIIIFIGIYPDFINGILRPASSELIDQIDYIRSVLG